MFSPAAERNKQPILEVLQQVLPANGRALEIASGTGQHASWFTAGLPGWQWQPSDMQAEALGHLQSQVTQGLWPRVLAPLQIDVLDAEWTNGRLAPAPWDAIYCANMLHISPWATCAALMQGAASRLAPGGYLITYGPYLEDGVDTSAGNLAFDQSLRSQNPAWGLRRREDVAEQAAHAGLHLLQRHAMPANNLLLVWGRPGD